MALHVGSRLGHYDVTALIGEGGIGAGPRSHRHKVSRQVGSVSKDRARMWPRQEESVWLARVMPPRLA